MLLGQSAAEVFDDLSGLLDPHDIAGTYTRWASALMGQARLSHAAGVRAAESYLRAYRTAETSSLAAASMPIVRPEFDARGAYRTVGWLPTSVRRAVGRGVAAEDALADTLDRIRPGWSKQAMKSGRDLVGLSAGANPRSAGWRLVADGDPCVFCATLVSRGPVYDANTVSSKRSDGMYHNNCGCTAEEVFGEWQPTKREQEFIDAYADAHEPGQSLKETLSVMRQRTAGTGMFSDSLAAPKALAGGSGGGSGRGGGKPPPVAATPDPSDKAAWGEHWRQRQDALGLETHGERLTPEEVLFGERLARVYQSTPLSEVIEWIPKDPTMRPTNDFIWLANNGLVTELKSPRIATGRQATRSIRDAITRARAQGVVKENFVVDFGDVSVNAAELDHLAGYNRDQRTTRVSRLWVMVRGNLTEIQLKK
jgi:hypothetical protein